MPKVILVFVIATFQTTTCLPENLTGVKTYVMQKQKIHWANGLNAVLAISPSKSDPSIDTLNVNMIVQVSTTAAF